MKQSSIDWLAEQILKYGLDTEIGIETVSKLGADDYRDHIGKLLQTARKMHRQEIVDAAECQTEKTGLTGDEYYTETFKQPTTNQNG